MGYLAQGATAAGIVFLSASPAFAEEAATYVQRLIDYAKKADPKGTIHTAFKNVKQDGSMHTQYMIEFSDADSSFRVSKAVVRRDKKPGYTLWYPVWSESAKDGGDEIKWVGPSPVTGRYVKMQFGPSDGTPDIGKKRTYFNEGNGYTEEPMSPDEMRSLLHDVGSKFIPQYKELEKAKMSERERQKYLRDERKKHPAMRKN